MRASLLAASAGLIALASSSIVGGSMAGCSDHDAPAASDAGSVLPPLEARSPDLIAPDQRRDAVSSPVVFDATRGGVWTANYDVGSISYADVDAHLLIQEIAVGKDIRSVALSPDARWVAAVDREGASVTLIDAESRVARRTIAVGSHPRAAVWDTANPRWLYVAVEDDDAVVMIDRTLGILGPSIPVGRLPSGLASSRLRREVDVTHRIDPKLSVIDLKTRSVSAEIAVADEPAVVDLTVPHGKPFAFEGLAWTPDGKTAWLPHELLAPTHPFQFKETLFPALSVLDLDGRTEVRGARMLLFNRINILDTTGNASIISQPCAAALHPNGIVGYALACASEDFLTFASTTGAAIDIIRNLPGDHPVGLTLDDTGQRAFVLSDQSHTLLTIDLAGGDPVGHALVTGKPLALIARDPVDAELREGLKLFFRANSAKGDLATTGNNWMSCGGCHLDGFASTNRFLFEALQPADRSIDAQIGHVGLKDLFSTTPTPLDPVFSPHDVLVALLDQGGLAPDRTGAHRDFQVDPNAPPPGATALATRLARVIARDLPVGPNWLLPVGEKPIADKDGEWCGGCHQAEYEAWGASVHAHAGEDPMVLFGLGVEQKARGPQYARLCAGCHDPVGARLGDSSLGGKRGVTCLGCHDVERTIRAGGNGDLEARTHDWTADHKARAQSSLKELRKPRFCGGCHQQFVPATGLLGLTTFDEYSSSPVASGATCVDCHMAKTSAGIADHRAAGGNIFMGKKFGDAILLDEQTKNLKRVATLTASRTSGGVTIAVSNAAGHGFPTGVTDIREPWIEVQALDAQKNVLARFGGPGADGLIPPNAARLGIDIARADGTVLFLHELSESTRIPFDFRIPSQQAKAVFVPVPAALPPGAVELDAVLFYRNVRTPYFRAATGDPLSVAPETELARVPVP